MKRILEVDPVEKTKEVFEYDESEGKAYVHQQVDLTSTIENNKALQNDGTGGWSPSRDMRRVGYIPNAVIELWRTKYGVDVFNRNHMPAVKRLLNDPEWRFLRTAEWKF